MKHVLVICIAIVGVAVTAFVCAPVVNAAEPPHDTTIGSQQDTGKALGGQKTPLRSVEPATGELGKGMERPMRAPEMDEGGRLDRIPMIVPDSSDFERGRESDIQSTMAF